MLLYVSEIGRNYHFCQFGKKILYKFCFSWRLTGQTNLQYKKTYTPPTSKRPLIKYSKSSSTNDRTQIKEENIKSVINI